MAIWPCGYQLVDADRSGFEVLEEDNPVVEDIGDFIETDPVEFLGVFVFGSGEVVELAKEGRADGESLGDKLQGAFEFAKAFELAPVVPEIEEGPEFGVELVKFFRGECDSSRLAVKEPTENFFLRVPKAFGPEFLLRDWIR
ncbi:MAG: hypothetical protein SGARI_000337 [Bacillariaceae sp.]